VSASRPLALALAWAVALGAGVPAARASRSHVVQPGESLWSIAEARIGDASLWPALYRANRDQIADPHRLHPGQRLAIPEVEPSTRAAVRREASALLAK
jgi:nucleoid-associated protein YgaU